MTLRRRIMLLAGGAVGIAVVVAAVVSYVAVSRLLHDEVDDALRGQSALIGSIPPLPRDGRPIGPLRFPTPRPGRNEPAQWIQFVTADGVVRRIGGTDLTLPVDARVRAALAGATGTTLQDVRVGGRHLRVATTASQGGAVQLARSLDPTDTVLRNLRLVLALVCLGGVGLAVALGRLVSRRVVGPIARVGQTAEHITATQDLGRRIEIEGSDEVAVLARQFNAMLDSLELSRRQLGASADAQRRLIADASHELRTPVTSLRTNLEVLAEQDRGADPLAPVDRERLLRDVIEQTEELGALVADLIELARGAEPPVAVEDVRLDLLVQEAVVRARRHASDVVFTATLEPTVVEGTPDRLGRAVNNLLDNAAKHSRPGGEVEVVVDRAGLEVRDHGDGIAAPDLEHIFDRFYRGAAERQRPGTGLGLAIVRQVAEAHGGSVTAENAAGGGARFRFVLPSSAPAGVRAG